MFSKAIYLSLFFAFVLMGLVQFKNLFTQESLEFEAYLPTFVSDSYTCPKSSIYAIFQPSANKKLIYVSPYHTSDIESNVVKKIESLIIDEKPDLVILEGFSPSQGINPEFILKLANERISSGYCSENLYAAYVCNKHKINFMGGDIEDYRILHSLLKKGYELKDAVFYMLIQQIPFWHKDHAFQKNNIKNQFEEFMHNEISDWFKTTINYSFEDFMKYHESKIGRQYDPEKDFLWDYGKSKKPWAYKGPGATIYQKIAADIMRIRDNHIIQVIRNSIQKHNKVLVIFGAGNDGGHYIWEKAALVTFLGQPMLEQAF